MWNPTRARHFCERQRDRERKGVVGGVSERGFVESTFCDLCHLFDPSHLSWQVETLGTLLGVKLRLGRVARHKLSREDSPGPLASLSREERDALWLSFVGSCHHGGRRESAQQEVRKKLLGSSEKELVASSRRPTTVLDIQVWIVDLRARGILRERERESVWVQDALKGTSGRSRKLKLFIKRARSRNGVAPHRTPLMHRFPHIMGVSF